MAYSYVWGSCQQGGQQWWGWQEEFSIIVGFRWGFVLSSCLVPFLGDELTNDIHEEVPCFMLFASTILLIDGTSEFAIQKLQQ